MSASSSSSVSSVRWMVSSGVSATMVALRSLLPMIAASPTMSPGPSWAISSPSTPHRHRAVEKDVGLVGRGVLPDRGPALGELHAATCATDPRDLVRSEVLEERCHDEPFAADDPMRLSRRPAQLLRDTLSGTRSETHPARQRVAHDRAAHAARSAAARAQLGAGDPDHLDAGLLEPAVGAVVAFVGDGQPGCQGQRVVAVVPLLAFGGHRVEAGVDVVQRVDLHRLGRRDQERLGRGDLQREVRRSSSGRCVTAYAVSVSATLGYITTLSTSTMVQTVSRCMVARSCAMGTARTVSARPVSNICRASRSAPAGVVRSPTPTAITPGASSSHVAALDVLEVVAVDPRSGREARVEAVDQLGQLGLALAGRHGQRGDRDPVAHPHRGVAGEEQVRQRVDEEVVEAAAVR